MNVQDKLQQLAFALFFIIFLAPVYLLLYAAISTNFFTDPTDRGRLIVWAAANHEQILGYIYRLTTAAIAVSIPFLMQNISWRPLAIGLFVLVVTLVLSAFLDAYIGRIDVVQRFQSLEIFYLPDLAEIEESARETARNALVGRQLAEISGYLVLVQQTLILIIGTTTGIKLAEKKAS